MARMKMIDTLKENIPLLRKVFKRLGLKVDIKLFQQYFTVEGMKSCYPKGTRFKEEVDTEGSIHLTAYGR